MKDEGVLRYPHYERRQLMEARLGAALRITIFMQTISSQSVHERR